MDEERIINELLHFIEASNDGMLSYFKHKINSSKEWCPFKHGEATDISCYLLNPDIKYLMALLEKYCLMFDFLDLDSFNLKELTQLISKLKDERNNSTYDEFKQNLEEIKSIIEYYSKKINEKLKRISCQELIRLDESVNCFQNHLFYASVVMSVSAVESRLHYLFKYTDKQLYNEFEKATIGQLLKVFQSKDIKYSNLKKLLPKEHKPLVELLNFLRVHSAHPKDKKITHKIAQSALNLSFNFLLDKDVKIDEKDLRNCDSD